jgi:hypothetical protein
VTTEHTTAVGGITQPVNMPWYTIIPPFGTHNPLGTHAWVPIDDERCSA